MHINQSKKCKILDSLWLFFILNLCGNIFFIVWRLNYMTCSPFPLTMVFHSTTNSFSFKSSKELKVAWHEYGYEWRGPLFPTTKFRVEREREEPVNVFHHLSNNENNLFAFRSYFLLYRKVSPLFYTRDLLHLVYTFYSGWGFKNWVFWIGGADKHLNKRIVKGFSESEICISNVKCTHFCSHNLSSIRFAKMCRYSVSPFCSQPLSDTLIN